MFVAGCVVFAGRILTILDVFRAVLACVSRPAVAAVVVDLVVAGGVVLAGLHLALVNVQLAREAGKAGVVTVASEHVYTVVALAAIKTRRGLTVVNVNLAVLSIVAGLAVAGVGVDAVLAGGLVLAGISHAVVNVELTIRAWKHTKFSHF